EHADGAQFRNCVFEKLLSLEQWERPKVEVLEGEEVERVERRGQLDCSAAYVDRRREAAALLEAGGARPPPRTAHDGFAVEDELPERERANGAGDLREGSGVVVAVAREEERFAPRLRGEQAVPVELELEEPAVARERALRRFGEHELRLRHVHVRAGSTR